VVINKIDRRDARPQEVLNEIFDLFIDLEADESQLDFPCLYAVGRDGVVMRNLDDPRENLQCLFETIVSGIPAPGYDPDEPFQMLVSDLDYSDYVGRLAIGKIAHGHVNSSDALTCIGAGGGCQPLKVTRLQSYDGVSIRDIDTAQPGDIVVLAGIEDVKIGDTICTQGAPKALPRITVDEPTVFMRIFVNTSPLAGKEGTIFQPNRIHERLLKETLRNVSIRLEVPADTDGFVVKGRGEFQLAILIETMRREGFELCVSRPEVICKLVDGKMLEPVEHLYVDCGDEYQGIVTQKVQIRKGRMVNYASHGVGRTRIEFQIPSRCLIGYHDEFLTDTRGTGIMSSYLVGYEEYCGEFTSRFSGSIVADRSGEAVAYALWGLQDRGRLFIVPGDQFYEGMIVGEHNRPNDIDVNPAREKKLSNMRAAGRDDNILLSPISPITLEQALQFIKDDEMVEVTPKSVRVRKTFLSEKKRHNLNGIKKLAAMAEVGGD